MRQCAEFLGFGLAGKQSDLSAIADTLRGCDALVVLKLNALLLHEIDKALVIGANFAGNRRRLGKLSAFGLCKVEDIDNAETDEHGLWLVGLVNGLLGGLTLGANHRSQNRNTLLPLLDIVAKLIPCSDARNVGCVGAMMRDGKNVSETVIVEAGHCAKVGCERFALALLKLLDQMLDVLSDDLLRGGLLAADFLLAAAVVVAVVVTFEIHVFVLLFRRDRLSVFLTDRK